jgi:hypothetical protein
MLLQEHIMSKIVTPEALLNSQVEEFNKGNISFYKIIGYHYSDDEIQQA